MQYKVELNGKTYTVEANTQDSAERFVKMKQNCLKPDVEAEPELPLEVEQHLEDIDHGVQEEDQEEE